MATSGAGPITYWSERSYRAIRTILSPAASAAPRAAADRIELFGQGFEQCRIVGQDPILEIAAVGVLRAHARAGQIRAAEISLPAVGDDAFEMDAGTQHPFDPGPQTGKPVEVLTKRRSGFLGVDQSEINPRRNQGNELLLS